MALDDADQKLLNDMIAKALAPLLQGFAKLTEAHKQGDERLTKLSATVDGLSAPPKPPAGEGEGEGKGKGAEQPQVPAANIARMEALEKKIEAEQAARRKAEADRRSSETNALIRDRLREANIRPEFTDVLLNHFRATGLIVDDPEANQTGWRTKDQFGHEMIQSVAEGVSAWASSAEADHYRPSRGVDGSGDAAGRPFVGRGTVTTATGILADLGLA